MQSRKKSKDKEETSDEEGAVTPDDGESAAVYSTFSDNAIHRKISHAFLYILIIPKMSGNFVSLFYMIDEMS